MKWFSESLGEKKSKATNEWIGHGYIKYRAGVWSII